MTTPELEHTCVGTDGGEWTTCIKGVVYGPCDHELCGGVCEPVADCTCPCHVSPEFEATLDRFMADNNELLRRLADGPGGGE